MLRRIQPRRRPMYAISETLLLVGQQLLLYAILNDSSSNFDEVGQLANSGQSANNEANSSPKIRACHFGFEYYELWDTCNPPRNFEVFPLLGTATGNMPWPDSFG